MMTAIGYEQIQIISPWEIQSINDLVITSRLSQHTECRFTAILSEDAGKKAGLMESRNDPVQVLVHTENTQVIFKGRLQAVEVCVQGGLYRLKACFLSESSLLDEEKKSRSFQDTSLTYGDIVRKVMQDYSGKTFELTAPGVKIDTPVIQYEETDWQFIRRMAALMGTVLAADSIAADRIFSFGYPQGGSKTLPAEIAYKTGKNIRAFYEDFAYNSRLLANEYAYYEVETQEALNIGDKVTFLDFEMYVGAVTIELKRGLLVYRARLVRKSTLRQNPIYNKKIQGISLEGTVLDVKDQTVKVHLAIDPEQNPDEAFWYPFAPPTTDMMYLMPQLGTQVSLYIPGVKEQDAVITGCVRTNGASCEQTGDPNTRYLATEYGQELKVAPGGIYFTAGREDLVLTLDDQQGVHISSHKGITMEAKEEIVIKSNKKVAVNAPGQVLLNTPSNYISMENEMYFRAPNVHFKK
ncbi:phage late control gene d protein (gpd) [Lucifera butyrica]|uniref:Phage late control gene d protein (Gpd) n=1 Tax=Lucifera butyrica TaxID=1351585 RepID=A0A498R894_9FIRM|nr:contractile injection system protein, VgrG/Pvc8 family [Lucifera butyrica]VBB07137.1 phage late control gene d protein (gpd) [Lucifera butyrica]